VESEDDEAALVAYMDALAQAQAFDRQHVRARAVADFQTTGVIDQLIKTLDGMRFVPPDSLGRRGVGPVIAIG
jgi:hypothetical protein